MSSPCQQSHELSTRALTSDELRLLHQRIDRLGDVAGEYRDRMTNCLQAAGRPEHALTLARSDAERLVKQVLKDIKIKPPDMLDACLRKLEEPEVMSRGLVPLEIISLLDSVRVIGNKAAHGALRIEPTRNDVHLVVQTLLRVVEWYFVEFERGPRVPMLLESAARRVPIPWQPPPLPAHHVRRPREEELLEQALLDRDQGPGVVVSAVFGLGGIGKSTLAAAVVRSQRVQEHFADGVLWVTLGQAPELISQVREWIRALGDHDFQAFDLRSACGRLRQLLQERAMLLVVDDAWDSEHVQPFLGGGPRCRVLVTTRRASIADDLGATRYELDVLEPEQAIQMLAARLKRLLRDEENELAAQLAEAVGRLPLALELAGVRLARGVSWEDLLQALGKETAALEALEDPAKRRQGKARLEASFNLSLRTLRTADEVTWRCFTWLGVLPDDTVLAVPMVSTVWGLSESEAAEVLEYLWGEALLLPGGGVRIQGREWPAYRIHDLLHDCARRLLATPILPKRETDLPGLGLTREQAHGQLLESYRARARDGQWHTLPVDGYIHSRLAWHLEQAGQPEQLHALLAEETPEGRNGWYEANERLGQPANFADDVARAWRLADQAFLDGGPVELGLQCRYALMTASLNSLARKLPPALLEALVQQGLWNAQQALAYARRTPDPHQKFEALAALAPHVAETERTQVLAEALEAAQASEDEAFRSDALVVLVRQLPARMLGTVLQAARDMEDKEARSRALAALAGHLAGEQREEVLAEALTDARDIGDERARSIALTTLAPLLPPAMLGQALLAVRDMRDEHHRSRALAGLAGHLPPERLAEGLEMARAIGDEEYRSAALAALAERLPADLVPEALKMARAIEEEEFRSAALTALIPHIPEQERAAVLAEALQASRDIPLERRRSLALAALAPLLPAQEQLAVLSQAFQDAADIGDDETRSSVLAKLAVRMPEQEQTVVLAEALQAARDISDRETRSRALAGLAAHWTGEEREQVLEEALLAARHIGDERSRSTALATLAPLLPDTMLGETLLIARDIHDEDSRAHALAALASRLPADLLAQTLEAARAIGDEDSCSATLAELLRLRARGTGWTARLWHRLVDIFSFGQPMKHGDLEWSAVVAYVRLSQIVNPSSDLLHQVNEGLAELSIRAVSSVWTEALAVMATGTTAERIGWGPLMVAGTRRRLHAYLRELAPVLPILAGPDRPEELQEITRALTDVERWWP